MNKLRSICYFALLIVVFCAEYRCAPKEIWLGKLQTIIDDASGVEPCQKMKVDLKSLLFEGAERNRRSYSHNSLTLIANEHTVQRDGETSDEGSSGTGTLVYHHFDIRSTNSSSRSESVLAFWSIQIKSFVFFASTGSKIKVLVHLMLTDSKGIVTLDFVNPGDAELFWHYALKNRRRRRTHAIDVLKFEIFDRRTKRRIVESSFAVIHKEWSQRASTTYTISLGSNEVTQKPLLIFLSRRFSVSKLIDDRIGLLVSDAPSMVFIIQFAPFENDAAVAFRKELFYQQFQSLHPMSDDELRSFIYK